MLSFQSWKTEFQLGKAVLEKVTHIHGLLWPEMMLPANRGKVLSSLFTCMCSVSIY